MLRNARVGAAVIYIQYIYICDLCHRVQFYKYQHYYWAELVKPESGPESNQWRYIGGKHICDAHQVETRLDGVVVVL